MSDAIRQTWLTDDKAVFNTLRKLEKSNEKLLEQNRKLTREGTEGNRKNNSLLDQGTTKIAAMATGYLSVQTALQLVNAELENKVKLQQQSLQLTRQESATEIGFLRNLGGTGTEQDKALEALSRISTETGITRTDLFAVASTAFSARGNLSTKQTFDAIRQAVQIAPESVGESTPIAGALLDLAKFTGTQDAAANLGFLQSVAQTARVTSLGNVSTNLIPAIRGVAATGASTQEAAALTTAITQAISDPTGAQGGTAATNFAVKLEQILPNQEDLFSRIEQVRTLAEDEQKAIIQKIGGDVKSRKVIEQLLTDATAAVSQDVVANVGRTADLSTQEGVRVAAEAAQKQVDTIRGTETQRAATADRSLKNLAQDLERDPARAITGSLSETTSRIAASVGVSGARQFVENRLAQMGDIFGIGGDLRLSQTQANVAAASQGGFRVGAVDELFIGPQAAAAISSVVNATLQAVGVQPTGSITDQQAATANATLEEIRALRADLVSSTPDGVD